MLRGSRAVVAVTVALLAAMLQPGRTSTELRAAAAQQPVAASHEASAQRVLLSKYCVSCHNQRLSSGGLALDRADVTHVAANPQIWEKVIRRLATRSMPPLGMPRPEEAAYDAFASWLEKELDTAAAAGPIPVV
jgi:hypothetical protein